MGFNLDRSQASLQRSRMQTLPIGPVRNSDPIGWAVTTDGALSGGAGFLVLVFAPVQGWLVAGV
jgi:hypothetical protein